MGSTRRSRARPGHGFVALALSLFAALGCLATGAPAPETALPSAQPPLRVATSGDYAPFSLWPEGDDEPHGFSVDLARAYARDRGRRIVWVRFRWPELTADLEAERFDLALSGITIRADRSLAGRFSLPVTATGAVALVAADSRFLGQADLDAAAVRIAVNRGGHLEGVARRRFPKAVIEAVPDNAAVPDRLATGRADAVVSDALEARHWQARLPATRVLGPFTRDRKAAWLPREEAALARDLDRWLLENERTGALARLRRRHGLADARTASAVPALLACLDERLSLMPAVALAKHVLGRPVEDRAQEERVARAMTEAVAAAAREQGRASPPDAGLRRFVEAQLRAAREVQTRELARLARGEPGSAGLATPDEGGARRLLEERVRPAVASISERIAWLLVAARAPAPLDASADEATVVDGSDADGSAQDSTIALSRTALAEAVAGHALSREVVDALFDSLEALVSPAPRARGASRADR